MKANFRTVDAIAAVVIAGALAACANVEPLGAVPGSKAQATTVSLSAGTVGAAHLPVPATSNIFAAGLDSASPLIGGGTIPPELALGPGTGRRIYFPSVTGEVSSFPSVEPSVGPAGNATESTDISSEGGISGIINKGGAFFLEGVFLTDAAPRSSAPARLDFSDPKVAGNIAPEIAQSFLIGDGKGIEYAVPDNATRLFLGFADADAYRGPPRFFDNNQGTLDATAAIDAG